MTRPVSVGIVGAGTIATTMHIPVLRATPGVTIAWVADSNEARARALAKSNKIAAAFGGDPSRLPACDAWLLAIPIPGRAAYFERAAATGIAVIAEKPLANDAVTHARLTGQFAPWQLAVGYQRRFYATSLMMRELIDTGVFGRLLRVRVSEGGRTTRAGDSGQYQDASVADGGGIIKNLGCHSLDLALWLTRATGAALVERNVEWDGDTDRAATAMVRLTGLPGKSGAACDLDWGVSWLGPQRNSVELQFEAVTVSAPVSPAATLELSTHDGRKLGTLGPGATGGAATSLQAFYLEWQDVLAAVREKRLAELSAQSCLATARLMDELLTR